jgi:DeoR/GlpR family transcriptional regulator of sugar metabolism
MLAATRQSRILAATYERGAVRISELTPELGVSPETIRRDLDALARTGLINRVHGGTLVRPGTAPDQRSSLPSASLPDPLIRAAAALVTPGLTIGLTAGATNLSLAGLLRWVPDLTVVTTSLPVVDAFGRSERQTVVVVGGERSRSGGHVGPCAVAGLARLNVDLLFLDVHGGSFRSGYTARDLWEAAVDRAFIAIASRVAVLLDHSRWNVAGVATVAPLSAADVVVTDATLPGHTRAELAQHVRKLVIADTLPANQQPANKKPAADTPPANQQFSEETRCTNPPPRGYPDDAS